jgi:Rod binding domain-containing protein
VSDGLKVTKPILEYGLLTKGGDVSAINRESKTSPEKMEKVSTDFEALMIFNMLKELDKTTHLAKKGYMEETYMSIVYDKVSQFLAKNKGLGIKELLLRYQERGEIKF